MDNSVAALARPMAWQVWVPGAPLDIPITDFDLDGERGGPPPPAPVVGPGGAIAARALAALLQHGAVVACCDEWLPAPTASGAAPPLAGHWGTWVWIWLPPDATPAETVALTSEAARLGAPGTHLRAPLVQEVCAGTVRLSGCYGPPPDHPPHNVTMLRGAHPQWITRAAADQAVAYYAGTLDTQNVQAYAFTAWVCRMAGAPAPAVPARGVVKRVVPRICWTLDLLAAALDGTLLDV